MLLVEIRVKGGIDASWSDWLGGLTVSSKGDECHLTGTVLDQAELYGLLSRLRDLGLALKSVHSEELNATGPETR